MSKFADIQIDPAISEACRTWRRACARNHLSGLRHAGVLAVSAIHAGAGARRGPRPGDIYRDHALDRAVSRRGGLGSWIRRIAVSKALMFLRSAWTARGQSLDDDWDEHTPGRCDQPRHLQAPGRGALDLDAALANLPVGQPDDCMAARCRRIYTQRDRDSDGSYRKFFKVAAVARLPDNCGRCWPEVTTLQQRRRPGVFER